MPTIPQYTKQVDEIGLPQVRQQSRASPELFGGADIAGRTGANLTKAGQGLEKHALELQQKEDTAIATQAEAAFLTKITDFKIQSRNRKGLDANSLPEEADKFFQDTVKEFVDSAPNERIKETLGVIFTRHQPGFHGYIGAHAAEQRDRALEDGFNASVTAQINAAAADPASADIARGRVVSSVKAWSNSMGMTPEAEELAVQTKLTELHTGVINALMVHSPRKATAYFATHKEEILGEQRSKIEGHLKATVDANDALEGADTVWAALGPKGDGQPVQLDVMEAEVRRMFDGDASKIKATIGEIRSRVQAFDTGERERAAANVNTVMEAYASGTPLAKLKVMPEFMALPGEQKAKIADHIDAKIDANLARSDAAEARRERKRQKNAFGAYLTYSNPEVLSGLTEPEIIALIPEIGEDKAGSLMEMKRKLNDPNKIIESKMDTDDFNQIANNMGLKPFGSRQTEDEKAALGGLRFRIEHLIQAQQDQLKRPLTRQEKNDIMRNETARTVTVEGGWFSSDKTLPVIQMAPEQVEKVIIPRAEREQALIRLKKLRARFPNDARYEPTERNLKMIYLQSQSQAADFIDGY